MALRDSVAYHGMYGIKSPAGMGLDALNGDIGAGKYVVGGNALKKHPDRTNKLPPNNLVLQDDPFWQSLDPETYEVLPGSPAAAVVTTDWPAARHPPAAAPRAQPARRSAVRRGHDPGCQHHACLCSEPGPDGVGFRTQTGNRRSR